MFVNAVVFLLFEQINQENELLSLWCDRIDLNFLGPGFTLYFNYVTACILMLSILLFISGIFNMISNKIIDNCEGVKSCAKTEVSRLSLVNKSGDNNVLFIQSWVNLAVIVSQLVFLQFYRRNKRLTENECNRGLNSPSDYTIMLSNLPMGNYTKEEIESLLRSYWEQMPKTDDESNKGFPVEKIDIAYDIHEYVEVVLQKKKRNDFLRKLIALNNNGKPLPKGVSIENVQKEVQVLQEKEDSIEKEALAGHFHKTVGVVFVTFSSQKQTENFLNRINFNTWDRFKLKLHKWHLYNMGSRDYLVFKGKILYAKRAHEPNDILWQNLGFKQREVIMRRLATWFVTFILLAACFAAIYGISIAQEMILESIKTVDSSGNRTLSENDKVKVSGLSVLASIIVVFINNMLFIFIKTLTAYEKHMTQTTYSLGIGMKLSLVLLINIINMKTKNIWGEGGFVNNVFSILVANAIIGPTLTLINIPYLLKLLSRRSLRKKGLNSLNTQAEAHMIFQGVQFDLAQRYAAVLKTVWLTSFYSSLIPLIIPISIGGLIYTYWADKYTLLRKAARPSLTGDNLDDEMVEFLEYSPMMIAVGSLFFNSYFFAGNTQQIFPDIISVILATLNFLASSEGINKKFFKIEESCDNDLPYQKAREKFTTEYDRANPVTHDEALIKWTEYIESSFFYPDHIKHSENILKEHEEILRRLQNGGNQNQGGLHNYANNIQPQGFSMSGEVLFEGQTQEGMAKSVNTHQSQMNASQNHNFKQEHSNIMNQMFGGVFMQQEHHNNPTNIPQHQTSNRNPIKEYFEK